MSANPVQTLDLVIDSVGRRFSDEANTLFHDSTCEVAEQVHVVSETDEAQAF